MSCNLIETSNAAAKAVAPGTVLSGTARAALLAALEQERHAQEIDAAHVAEYGDIAPFANHLKARRRRTAALTTMARAYGLRVPKPPRGADEHPSAALPGDFAAACAASVAAEAARLRRYDESLIPAVAEYPGLGTVMTALRDRTRDHHLPALRRALAEATGIPDLHGSGHVHGHGRGHGGCHGHSDGHPHERAPAAHHGHGSGGCGHHRRGQPQAQAQVQEQAQGH